MTIPLSRPDITELEIEAVVNVLRSPDLSLGPKLPEFERSFAEYIGVPHAVAVSSGTAGLHLALEALGISEGDEVILPSFTFIAVANAICQCRATPVFADIDPQTLNITAATIGRVTTPKTRAVVLVHTFGQPADLGPILTLARQHNLFLIEDACEAIGAEYQGARIGSFGQAAVFSFYPNKPITTGEGGVLVTADAALARTVRAMRNQGRREGDGWLEHSFRGYNYRLPEINCALGIVQLQRIESILARRERVAQRYSRTLAAIPGLQVPRIALANGRVSWFAFVVLLPEYLPHGGRDRVMEILDSEGIQSRPYFPPLHLQPLYAAKADPQIDLSVTENAGRRSLALPFFNALPDEHVDEVCRVLDYAVARCRR